MGARRSLISCACMWPEGVRPRDGAAVIESGSFHAPRINGRAGTELKTGGISPAVPIGVPGNRTHGGSRPRKRFTRALLCDN
jgi:hypothetical protein